MVQLLYFNPTLFLASLEFAYIVRIPLRELELSSGFDQISLQDMLLFQTCQVYGSVFYQKPAWFIGRSARVNFRELVIVYSEANGNLISRQEKSTPSATSTSSPTPTGPLFTEADGTYSVNLTPADFVDVVDNPYFPLPAGAKWEYEIRQRNGSRQMDTLEVLKEKRNVNGVQATLVRGTVSAGNQIVEDTFDWFAQDQYGNVWYVGESVDNDRSLRLI